MDYNFKELMERAGFSQFGAAAMAIGSGDTLLSSLAKGNYPNNPRPIFIKRMAEVFRCSEEQVINSMEISRAAYKKLHQPKVEPYVRGAYSQKPEPPPAPTTQNSFQLNTLAGTVSKLQGHIGSLFARMVEVETQLSSLNKQIALLKDQEAKRREGMLPL